MNPDNELRRYEIVQKLKNEYELLCRKYFGWFKSPKNSFGRWLTESILFNKIDCLLPDTNYDSNPLYKEISDDFPNKIYPLPGLIKDRESLFTYLTLFKRESKRIINKNKYKIETNVLYKLLSKIDSINVESRNFEDTYKYTIKLTTEMNTEMKRVFHPLLMDLINSLTEISRIEGKELKEQSEDVVYKFCKLEKSNIVYLDYLSLNYENTQIRLPSFVFKKLEDEYIGDDLLRDVWILFKRYEILTNIDTNSASLQAGVPYKAMDFLRDNFGVDSECFASPINHYFNNYCSAFADIDCSFNSKGSFFDFMPETGSFEANPPFSEILMYKAVKHIEHILSSSGLPLSFIIVLPKWDDAESLIFLRQSEFFRCQVILKPNQHYYRQSDQTKEFKARYESTLFFLRNKEGNLKWPIDEEKINGLINSFS